MKHIKLQHSSWSYFPNWMGRSYFRGGPEYKLTFAECNLYSVARKAKGDLTGPMMNVNYLRKVWWVGGWDAGHVVSWGMEGHASNASNATASGLAGSPTTHWPPPTRPSFLHNGDTSSFNPLSPVGALYQMVWLCLAVEGPPAGRPIIGLLSPAQFETNHRETRWASDGRWRMEENTNSEIQSQDWYNQVAHKKRSKTRKSGNHRKLNH